MNEKSNGRSWGDLLSPFQNFVRGESAGGFLLIISAFVAFAIANSPLSAKYFELQSMYFGLSFGDWSLKKPLVLWINDGLMAIFFLMVGLEIKRELLVGELSRPRDAALSVFAALGGMVVPATIYAFLNWGGQGAPGWGIPMATDIAFALGVMSLLGDRVPLSLKVFLTALAIVDDLGAVAVIAIFYTANLNVAYLLTSMVLLLLAFSYGYIGGRRLPVYWIVGAVAWYFMLKSGVHATVAGVLLAFAVPMSRRIDDAAAETNIREIVQNGSFEETEVKVERLEAILHDAQSPLHRLEHALQPWVAFFIMPVFAFFNAGVQLGGGIALGPIALGCFVGLLLGKPIGILLFSWAAERLGWAVLPKGVSWMQIGATGVLAGIGFTMSFFIAGLAFDDGALLDRAKIGVLSASIAAAIAGFAFLKFSKSSSVSKKELT